MYRQFSSITSLAPTAVSLACWAAPVTVNGHIVLVLVARCSDIDWHSHRELTAVRHSTADLGDLGAQIFSELGDIKLLYSKASVFEFRLYVPREDEVAIVSHDGLHGSSHECIGHLRTTSGHTPLAWTLEGGNVMVGDLRNKRKVRKCPSMTGR